MLDTEWTKDAIKERYEQERKLEEIQWKRFKSIWKTIGIIFGVIVITWALGF